MAVIETVRVRVERFDLVSGGVIVILATLIGLVIIGGDRAGVAVSLIDPTLGMPLMETTQPISIPYSAPITLRFSEPMDAASASIVLTPSVPGKAAWSGSTWTFTPATALVGGQTYTLQVQKGSTSAAAREVRSDHRWILAARTPAILFLYPAIHAKNNESTNLYRVQEAGKPEQLTDSPFGIEDYAPSPDGSQIAFTQNDQNGKTDLFLLDLASRSTRRLTNCVDASCRAPSWNPDGIRIVYERADSKRIDADARAWIVNTRTLSNTPLFIEQRWLARSPRWSRDGRMIALYDRELSAIVLVDAVSGERSLIQTLEDDPGQFSFDAVHLAYAQLMTTPQGVIRQTEIADFGQAPRTVRPLAPPDGAIVDDSAAAWNPDGQHLAIMRRYLSDERATEKFQVYQVDATTGTSEPLVVDPAYAHGYLSWRADGAQLLMQRYPYQEPAAEPSIWFYDVRSKALTQVAINGFMPRWIP
jgi:Tol biopolymer transport system component